MTSPDDNHPLWWVSLIVLVVLDVAIIVSIAGVGK